MFPEEVCLLFTAPILLICLCLMDLPMEVMLAMFGDKVMTRHRD